MTTYPIDFNDIILKINSEINSKTDIWVVSNDATYWYKEKLHHHLNKSGVTTALCIL